jgi:histidine triad (HIT) family protein
MFNHAPENYECPICLGVNGIENDDTYIKQSDIVYKDDTVTAFIGSFFVGDNPGHVIVVPNEHFENIYDLPEGVGYRIFDIAKLSAKALKETRECEGITTLQNNEPAGGQHAFHYHFHVFPRFENDNLHTNMHNSRKSEPEERKPYAEALKEYFKNNS